MLARTTGTVVGTVVDAETGIALSGVGLSAQYLGGVTDEDGAYDIVYLDPGNDEIVVERRDLVEKRVPVKIIAAEQIVVDVAVEKARPGCCRLDGTWSISMTPARSHDAAAQPVVGSITFSESLPDPFPNRRRDTLDETLDEFGVYDIDVKRLFGYDYLSKRRTDWLCEGTDECSLLREAEGYVSQYDRVDITLIPAVADFGLGLSGTIRGDRIQGEWIERAYAGGVGGTFEMVREPR